MSDVLLGIAPIGWTNDDLPELGGTNTFEQCISEMALAGFSGSEIGNKYPKDPVALNKALKLRNLTICNAWFSTYFTTKSLDEVENAFIKHRDFLYAVGARVIGVSEQGNSIQGNLYLSIFDNKPIFSDSEWEKVAKGLNRLAQLAEEKGMTLGYHHHMGTGVESFKEIQELMNRTNRNVYLLFDTGHAYFAGIDPIKLLKTYIERINHVHLKDVRKDILEKVKREQLSFLSAVKNGVFTVPGDGNIEFKPIFEVLKENNYVGWYVVEAEQDPSIANPFEYALKARSYIKETAQI
ncbi:MAG: myo-inosose-2 dehydratase [Fusobacteria bacterium]|nr:myo-inosose-2 dehydratase [Fusobacteriota bacterium]